MSHPPGIFSTEFGSTRTAVVRTLIIEVGRKAAVRRATTHRREGSKVNKGTFTQGPQTAWSVAACRRRPSTCGKQTAPEGASELGFARL